MKIELQGSIQKPDITKISNLKELKDLKDFYSNIILKMVDSLKWKDTDDSFEEETYDELEDYLNNLQENNPDITYSFKDKVYEKVRDFCVDSLWNQNEDVITDISFHEYYYSSTYSGYDFYITFDVDMDKIVNQIREETEKDGIDLENER